MPLVAAITENTARASLRMLDRLEEQLLSMVTRMIAFGPEVLAEDISDPGYNGACFSLLFL